MEITHNLNEASVKRMAEIYPILAVRVYRMAHLLWKEGIEIQVVQGLRTWNQQSELYEQGRTKPGAIVTWARPGYSWHQFGVAADLCFFEDGKPNWDLERVAWQRIPQMAENQGLVAGARWPKPDFPHVQLTGPYPTVPNDEVRQTLKDGGMISIWREIDKFLGVDPPQST